MANDSQVPSKQITDEQIITFKNNAIHNGQLIRTMEKLHDLEKQYRLVSDIESIKKILTTIVDIYFETKQWQSLNDEIMFLNKRRSQTDTAIQSMVQHCITLLADGPENQKIIIIETLRTICRGKLLLEIEYARLTKMFSKYKEQKTDYSEAANILNELQAETLVQMDKRERTDLILEQIRLNLLTKNLVKAQIGVKKINPNIFAKDSENELKFRFYGLRIQMDHNTDFLETSRHYQAIFNTNAIRLSSKRKKFLVYSILYCVLHPYGAEQYNMMEYLWRNEYLHEIPTAKHILQLMLSKELINWSKFSTLYKTELEKWFNVNQHQCWRQLIYRIIEHNIRIVSMHYTRIFMDRLTELLEIPFEKCEEILSRMICEKSIIAKIDRPSKIVQFLTGGGGGGNNLTANEKLNNWMDNIDNIMKKVQYTTHLINQEMASCNIKEDV